MEAWKHFILTQALRHRCSPSDAYFACSLRCAAGGAPGSFWEYQGRQLADWDSDGEGLSEEDPALQEALARSLRT